MKLKTRLAHVSLSYRIDLARIMSIPSNNNATDAKRFVTQLAEFERKQLTRIRKARVEEVLLRYEKYKTEEDYKRGEWDDTGRVLFTPLWPTKEEAMKKLREILQEFDAILNEPSVGD